MKEQLPITRPILLAILATFDTNTQRRATYHAAFSLAFASFLRMGEFTWSAIDQQEAFAQWHMTRAAVSFAENQIYLQLPASKTDLFRQGVKLTIAAANNKACAVNSLKNLYNRFPTSLHAPLFEHQPWLHLTRSD